MEKIPLGVLLAQLYANIQIVVLAARHPQLYHGIAADLCISIDSELEILRELLKQGLSWNCTQPDSQSPF